MGARLHDALCLGPMPLPPSLLLRVSAGGGFPRWPCVVHLSNQLRFLAPAFDSCSAPS